MPDRPVRPRPGGCPGGCWPGPRSRSTGWSHPLGQVSIGNHPLPVGVVWAGQRLTIRLEGQLAHVLAPDGTLWRTHAFTLPAAHRARLQGARPAGPPPPPHQRLRPG